MAFAAAMALMEFRDSFYLTGQDFIFFIAGLAFFIGLGLFRYGTWGRFCPEQEFANNPSSEACWTACWLVGVGILLPTVPMS